MRLMLGTNNAWLPWLLVEVKQKYSSAHFKFLVVNGLWEGTFRDGRVTVHHIKPWTILDKCKILCDDQDLLRGEYNAVFQKLELNNEKSN